jgi:hypothetical protein
MKHTMKTTLLVAALAALTTVAACKKDDKDAGGGSGKAKETDQEAKEPAKAKGSAQAIDAFGLAFDGPSDVQINDMTMGSAKTYMVMGTGLVFSVAEPSDISPKTLEEAVEASKIYDGATITKQEKTADGYHLEFNNKGSMGANYFVEIRRTIGEKPYVCSTTAPDAAMASAAVAACQSLRAK